MAILAATDAVNLAAGTGDEDSGITASDTMVLVGFAVAEAAGTAAVASATLHHGTASTDPKLCPVINVDADGFDVIELPGGGVSIPNGVWVERVTGNTEWTFYVRKL